MSTSQIQINIGKTTSTSAYFGYQYSSTNLAVIGITGSSNLLALDTTGQLTLTTQNTTASISMISSASASSNYLVYYQASLSTGNYTQQLFGVSSTYAGLLSFKYASTTASQNYIYLGVNNGTFVNINYDGSIKINCTTDASTYDGTTGSLQVNHS